MRKPLWLCILTGAMGEGFQIREGEENFTFTFKMITCTSINSKLQIEYGEKKDYIIVVTIHKIHKLHIRPK